MESAERRVCDFPVCDRKHSAKGYCANHYYHFKAGNPLRPLNNRATEIALGLKTCRVCETQKPVFEYTKNASRKDGFQNACRRCKQAIDRLSKYNISPEIFEDMVSQQEGRCAMCQTEVADHLVVDHDHACCPGERSCGACVRGLLCAVCNRGLGCYEKHRVSAEQYLGAR